MSVKITIAALLASACLILAGCAAAPTSPTPASASPTVASADIQARHGLTGLSVTQIIDKLDATEADRTNGPVGSVRPNALQLTDSGGTAVLPIEDRFYLSIAPYLNTTHDCFNHNVATCKGELAGRTIHVRITDAAGALVLERDQTTYPNGFAGFWLPKNITATLTVSYDGKTATTPISTGDDDPTCLTTLKLS